MTRFLSALALGMVLTTSCTGCFLWWKSPADLPSRITVGVASETGQLLYETPNNNVVTTYVDEVEANALQDYKIDKFNLLDGDKIISTSNIRVDGKDTLQNVKIDGPTGRKGTLYVEAFSSSNVKYRLKSSGWSFTVIKKEKTFDVTDAGINISMKMNCAPTVALVQIFYDDTNYGVFLCGTAIILPKPTQSVQLTFMWMDADGSILSQTNEVLNVQKN